MRGQKMRKPRASRSQHLGISTAPQVPTQSLTQRDGIEHAAIVLVARALVCRRMSFDHALSNGPRFPPSSIPYREILQCWLAAWHRSSEDDEQCRLAGWSGGWWPG